MLKSNKHVFWEALIITIIVFLSGIFLGMIIETTNSNEIAGLYIQSEISLADATTTSRLTEEFSFDCETIKESNIDFANRVYEEAKLLERYEDSGKLTDNIKLLHKKYDLLRTLLWANNQKTLETCENYNLIVYLYEYGPEDTTKKAVQNVWSKILLDVKKESENTLLLPIAANQNLTSLDLLVNKYEIIKLPAVVINNKDILYNLESAESLRLLLD